LKSAGEVVDKIVNLKEERTFENTIKPLSLMESNLSTQQNNFSFYRYVSSNKDQREASIKVEEKYDAFEINLWLREDLYKAINDFKNE
jgi:thimet oligopeptidase